MTEGRIAPRTGTAFLLQAGQTLQVIDPLGGQVADLLAYNAHDLREVISSGRTLDYAGRLYLTTGDKLYSNRSTVMLTIAHDDVGRHDFLLTPCSEDTFRILYNDPAPHRGCFGNLVEALAPWGLSADDVPVAFNCFMNVDIDGTSGVFSVLPPLSVAGDRIELIAEIDLLIAVTACSAPLSNGGSFKPIDYRIFGPG